MKRVIAIVLIALMFCMILSGCNESLGFGNYSWKHIHFSDAVGGHCATITKWYDCSTGIEVHTEEYGAMFLSEGSYIMFETSNCPYCD